MMIYRIASPFLIGNLLGAVLVVIASYSKESYDCKKEHPTGFNFMDIKANFYGMLYGAIIINVLAVVTIYVIAIVVKL